MGYVEQYNEKLMTAKELMKYVKSGMHVHADISLSVPPAIVHALDEAALAGQFENVTFSNAILNYPMECLKDPAMASRLRVDSWFSSGITRKSVNAGISDIFPAYYRQWPELIREYQNFDIFIACVSPMDSHGYFSFGATGSAIPAAIEKSSMVLLEVNDKMPRALGGQQIHISEVTALCENNVDLLTSAPAELDETSLKIGAIIADEIPDGSCLQIGIGAIPDAVGSLLKDKKHLGIHTEMFTSCLVDLVECGAVDNSRKQHNKGYSVTTFAFGSQKIYDYIDNNPRMKVLPVDYVNDPAVIAQLDNFMSINGAVEVDILGQVSAESVGTKHISGTGGQVDYVQGATHSKGGKSFIAFSSTTAGGKVSRIKNILTPGSVVTTSKNDVDYIVTEYGMAKLRGQTIGSRVKQLISIAHPDFRDELTFEAKKRGIIV